MATYLGLLAMVVLGLLGVGAVYLLWRTVTVHPESIGVNPFLSGFIPEEHALSRFHARWYPMTLIFLAFDVEMLFMYPWAVVVAEMGASAVVEMFIFLGVLMAGVVWAWREGALRWT